MAPSVAVVGASSDRRKFGNKAVRAYLRAGYDVFPVNPSESAIEGLPAYRSVRDVPRDRLDRVTVYLPPAVGLTALDEIASKPAGTVFLNPGADSPEVVEKAKRLGLNVVTGCSIVAVGVRPDMFPDE
jgi:predicted CoA-binding protein